MILSEFGRDSGQSLDSVRMASKSKKKRPTASCDGHESIHNTTGRRERMMLEGGTGRGAETGAYVLSRKGTTDRIRTAALVTLELLVGRG